MKRLPCSRQTYFSMNDETRFPPSGRGLEGNGPASLRVELDTGGSAFQPVSQPIKCGHGRSAIPGNSAGIAGAGASNLDALIRQAREIPTTGRGSGRAGRGPGAPACRRGRPRKEQDWISKDFLDPWRISSLMAS